MKFHEAKGFAFHITADCVRTDFYIAVVADGRFYSVLCYSMADLRFVWIERLLRGVLCRWQALHWALFMHLIIANHQKYDVLRSLNKQ